LRNGPTYVALVLWLNGPPCKWSGVEWKGQNKPAFEMYWLQILKLLQ